MGIILQQEIGRVGRNQFVLDRGVLDRNDFPELCPNPARYLLKGY